MRLNPTKKIHIRSYGQYSSKNYGINTLLVRVGKIELYFSYETVIAFWLQGQGLTICENVWTRTTGKHLNWINPDKNIRLPYDDFVIKLNNALKEFT
jgi:hypothetical protein